MELESHVDRVLEEAGVVKGLYHWNCGLVIPDPDDAPTILEVLQASEEFGPTFYEEETGKVDFGVHKTSFDGNDADYVAYCSLFEENGIGL